MVGKGFRRTAVNDVALSQSDDFTANSIQDEVEAHPVMDGRNISTIAIGTYLGFMAIDGYIKSWTEDGGNTKTYRVNGHRIGAPKLL